MQPLNLEQNVQESYQAKSGSGLLQRMRTGIVERLVGLVLSATLYITLPACGDEATCETNADCSEGTQCLEACRECVPGEGCSNEYIFKQPDQKLGGKPYLRCEPAHCYEPSQTTTTTHTRVD